MTSPAFNGNRISVAQVRQRVSQAEQALRAGCLPEAEQICREVLVSDRRNFSALKMLGLALAQRGDLVGAENALRECLAVEPRSASTYVNLGNVHSLQGNHGDAENAYRKALSLTPNHPEALFNLGIALKNQKRLDEAKTSLAKAIAIRPDYTDAIVQHGVVLMAQGSVEDALHAFDRAISQRESHFGAQYNRGIALMRLDRWQDAKLSLARAGAINDRSHDVFLALGRTLHRLQELGLATSALGRAAALKPDSAEAHAALAMVFLDDGWTKAALDEISKAIGLNANNSNYHIAHARVLAELNRLEEATTANLRAVELAPDSMDAVIALGRSHMSAGRLDEARSLFLRARDLHSESVEPHLNLARIDKFKAGDERLEKLEEFLSPEHKLQPDQRTSVHFVLGRAYDELGEFDRAFEHFSLANAEQRLLAKDAETQDIDFCERTKKVYTKSFLQSRSGTGSTSQLPIFVVGMPRSGTTLTEQIISSHPLVKGAGEVQDAEIATRIVAARRKLVGDVPDLTTQLTDSDLRDIGDIYVERLMERAPGASRVTDKLLGNYARIGLIHLTLPNAKIIHCQRNPIDCCLSIYTNQFAETRGHTSDLAQLGRYYRRYHDVMKHWRSVLPDSFLDLPYEETVSDLEGTARKIIAYCGLEWDPRCLEFNKNERRVATLSVTQVRRPVYKSSVERWRNYEKHLGPLIEGLGDIAPI